MYPNTDECVQACKPNHHRHTDLEHKANKIDGNKLDLTDGLKIANGKWSCKYQTNCCDKVVQSVFWDGKCLSSQPKKVIDQHYGENDGCLNNCASSFYLFFRVCNENF